jgi:EAL domain-containing protein (putative c-di-GMP-specific phosphodiesterase class I)
MGGDEFMAILPSIRDAAQAAAAARRMLDALRPTLEIDGHELRVSASVGVTLYPFHGEDVGTLMRNADRAMYRAKEGGKNDFCIFTPHADGGQPSRLAFESQLHRAIERAELRLEYQPQIDLASGEVVALEALFRWQSHEFGLVMPEDMIPIAEETGMIVSLGEWVLREACRQSVAWIEAGQEARSIAVNVSQVQFRRDDFVDVVTRAIEATGLPPGLLELELTESVMMRDTETAVARIRQLRAMGILIALDDFGVGYSSLSYLRRLPLDTLKIDRSFVRDVEEQGGGRVTPIVEPIIALAHSLGLRVVAEGVESQGQLAKLRRLGCDRAQGFAIARPRPAAELVPLLDTHRRSSS